MRDIVKTKAGQQNACRVWLSWIWEDMIAPIIDFFWFFRRVVSISRPECLEHVQSVVSRLSFLWMPSLFALPQTTKWWISLQLCLQKTKSQWRSCGWPLFTSSNWRWSLLSTGSTSFGIPKWRGTGFSTQSYHFLMTQLLFLINHVCTYARTVGTAWNNFDMPICFMRRVIRLFKSSCFCKFWIVLAWNEKVRFDFILVLFSIIENILVFDLFGTSAESGGSGVNLGFLRLLRLCKIVKILRVFRTLRFFSELRLMLDCVVGSLMNVFWCLIMLIFVMYVFALLLQQGVVQYLQERTADGNDGSQIGLQTYFSSVGVTVVTLFQSCTSGVDWSEPYKALQPTGWVLPISFLLYIAFAPGWYFQLDACILI